MTITRTYTYTYSNKSYHVNIPTNIFRRMRTRDRKHQRTHIVCERLTVRTIRRAVSFDSEEIRGYSSPKEVSWQKKSTGVLDRRNSRSSLLPFALHMEQFQRFSSRCVCPSRLDAQSRLYQRSCQTDMLDYTMDIIGNLRVRLSTPISCR